VSHGIDENYLYSVKEAAKALYVCKATLERAASNKASAFAVHRLEPGDTKIPSN